jgi:tRNA(Ile)-lysidine synthase
MTRAPAELRRVADLAAKALARVGVPEDGDGVAVAVSGGADSLALLHALRVLSGPRRWRLAVLTVDHGLHPGSAADAAFVADQAKSLGLPTRVLTLTPADLAAHRAAGPEGAARAARYAALWPAAGMLGCQWLATGHTLDDQAETVLLQLLRGTGPDGLAGMPVRSGRLLRPLLAVRRSETHVCCTAAGLAWRDDPTNATDGPLRNRVRHHLLPLLEQLRPGATQTLARTATLAADERTWLDPLVATALAATTSPTTPSRTGAGEARPDGSRGEAGGAGAGGGEGAEWRGGVGGEGAGGRDGAEGRGGAVDSGEPPSPPWATLPVGAPHSQGAYPQPPVDLDAAGLADLPVALGRRVVRAAAVGAGVGSPDAAATDRVLALTRASDGARTAWPGGMAVRDGPTIRLRPPAD